MKTLLVLMLALFACLAHGQAYKKSPDNGYWWNPNEPGRGWTFETQNDLVAITHYGYNTDGTSTFFQSVARWNPLAATVTAELSDFRGGACFGCPISTPSSTNLGTVRFTFTDEFNGTVTYPNGTTVAIERFDYGYASPVEFQLGAWSTIWFGGTSSFDNFFTLSQACSTTTPPNCVQGSLKLNRAGRIVVSAPVSGTRLHLMLVDSATGFYDYYYTILSGVKMIGLACTASSTGPAPSPNSCNRPLFGYRVADFIEASVLFGASPSKTNIEQANAEMAARQRELVASLGDGAKLIPEILEHDQALGEVAESLRQYAQSIRR